VIVKKAKRVGFIIDNCLPTVASCLRFETSPRVLFSGWPTGSATTEMRFGWLAQHVNKHLSSDFCYELYRPWRSYDAVIFLKSFSPDCLQLARELKARNITTVFDLNVDYLSPAVGRFYYNGMAPTKQQRSAASAMVKVCDAVLCASQHIASVVSADNENVYWVPDNVRDDLISRDNLWLPKLDKYIPIVWSGQATKLFELLKIKDVLLSFADNIHLKIITNSLGALKKWYEPYEKEFHSMLKQLSHEIIPFTSIDDLMKVYAQGGVCISPRFLDSSYNLGHSEWKITLAMAKGCITLASEQKSYIDVYDRADGHGLRICRSNEEWEAALKAILDPNFSWKQEQDAALTVVKDYYSSSVIADQHASIMNKALCG